MIKPTKLIEKTKKTKKQLQMEFNDRIRMQEAEQFMHLQNQAIKEVTGNNRDKDGNMNSFNPLRGS